MTIQQLEDYIKERSIIIPLQKIKLAKWNYKDDDEDTAEKLVNSIKKEGLIQVLNVREIDDNFYEVGDGNHRLIALQKLEYEGAWCLNHGKISVEKLIEISFALNELQFKTDTLKLSDVLNNYNLDLESIVSYTPYTLEDLSEIRTLADFDWDQYNTGHVQNDDEEWIDIKVRAPKIEAEIYFSEIERIKEIAKTDSEWVALKLICVNSAQTPTESLE